MSAPLYVNLWQSTITGMQWTDGWPREGQTREFCDQVADDVHRMTSIRRIAVLRVTPKHQVTA